MLLMKMLGPTISARALIDGPSPRDLAARNFALPSGVVSIDPATWAAARADFAGLGAVGAGLGRRRQTTSATV
jgi:hypothetical protein